MACAAAEGGVDSKAKSRHRDSSHQHSGSWKVKLLKCDHISGAEGCIFCQHIHQTEGCWKEPMLLFQIFAQKQRDDQRSDR